MTTRPRPALRRAPDADVHPALLLRLDEPELETGEAGKTGSALERAPGTDKSSKADKADAGKAGKSGKADKAGGSSFLAAGHATSDSMRLGRPQGKKVDLKVKVPKSLRKQLRERAAQSDQTLDALVTEVLVAGLGDGRWW
ncbi:MAG: hypothetical protein U0990_02840 [Candidatus Nanopelagicales bacterium]|nr:hypothetical protein [Candidatus Nanopelagicales bacterium]MDZ4249008.1 hypothetical protein [Candidatus Nanopelagicales bacterium]